MGHLPGDVIYKIVRGNAIRLLRVGLRQVTVKEGHVFVGGSWIEAGNGGYDVVNPATEAGRRLGARVFALGRRSRRRRGRVRRFRLVVAHITARASGRSC